MEIYADIEEEMRRVKRDFNERNLAKKGATMYL